MWSSSIQSLSLHHEKLSKYSSQEQALPQIVNHFSPHPWRIYSQAKFQYGSVSARLGFRALVLCHRVWWVLLPLLQREGECQTAQHRDHNWPTRHFTAAGDRFFEVFKLPVFPKLFWFHVRHESQFVGCSCGAPCPSLGSSIPGIIPCSVFWGTCACGVVALPGAAGTAWVWSLLQQGSFSARGDSASWRHQEQESWACSDELMLIQSRKSKCQCCEMQKKEIKKSLGKLRQSFLFKRKG